jgi:hypothetical protein
MARKNIHYQIRIVSFTQDKLYELYYPKLEEIYDANIKFDTRIFNRDIDPKKGVGE